MLQTRNQKVYPFQNGGALKFLFSYSMEETDNSPQAGNKKYDQINFDNSWISEWYIWPENSVPLNNAIS